MTHTNTLCGQNAEFLNVKHDGVFSNHCALKVKLLHGIPSVLWQIKKQLIYLLLSLLRVIPGTSQIQVRHLTTELIYLVLLQIISITI
jgi:hypothetical protein